MALGLGALGQRSRTGRSQLLSDEEEARWARASSTALVPSVGPLSKLSVSRFMSSPCSFLGEMPMI
jgi:hypothetical protein